MLKNKKYNTQSGFGLVELMVSISLVVLVTSVILARHDSYNGAILLRSQAYDIALKIREVQMQAVSVVAQDQGYRAPLGVCFSTNHPNYYHIFADADDDGVCEDGEYVGQRGNIDPRFEISSLVLKSTLSSGAAVEQVAILFERPNFDARFFVGSQEQNNVEAVEIGLLRVGASQQSTNVSDLRVMEISRTGQILVKSAKSNTVSVPCEQDDNLNKECDDDNGGGIDPVEPPVDGSDNEDKGGSDPVENPPSDEENKGEENTDPKDNETEGETELPPENSEEPKV